MHINFGGFEEFENVEFYIEAWVGDHMQYGTQSGPKMMVIQQLNGMAYEILQDTAPRKMYVKTEFYEDGKKITNEKTITNKAWDNAHEQSN